MRLLLFIFGVALAAVGGVIAYRTLFLEPEATIVITNSQVHQYPSALRLLSGLALLVIGAAVAFFGLRRTRA